MKYKRKPVIVEAVPYKFGMEHGIRKFNEYIDADGAKYPILYRSEKYPRYHKNYENQVDEMLNDKESNWKPYVIPKDQYDMIYIYEGDMIIYDENNNVIKVYEKEAFENKFELAE